MIPNTRYIIGYEKETNEADNMMIYCRFIDSKMNG